MKSTSATLRRQRPWLIQSRQAEWRLAQDDHELAALLERDVGRFVAFLGPLLADTIIAALCGYGTGATVVGLIYVVGMIVVPFRPETPWPTTARTGSAVRPNTKVFLPLPVMAAGRSRSSCASPPACERTMAMMATECGDHDRRTELLNVLSPRQREIIRLRVVLGLSAQETADRLGMAPAAVRLAQHRALNKLRATLTN